MAKSIEGTFIENQILSKVPKEYKTKVMNLLRLALTGKPDGLPVGDIIWVIGFEEAKRRINRMLEYYDGK